MQKKKHNFWGSFSLAAVDPIGLDVRTLLLQIGVYRNPYKIGLYTETSGVRSRLACRVVCQTEIVANFTCVYKLSKLHQSFRLEET